MIRIGIRGYHVEGEERTAGESRRCELVGEEGARVSAGVRACEERDGEEV